MVAQRNAQRAPVAVERRPPVPVRVQASANTAARSPVRALQSRLGNQATQSLVARALAPTAKVSKPTDAAELEAEETARKVSRMQQPAATASSAGKGEKSLIQRAAAAQSASALTSAPVPQAGAGSPLPASVRKQMEPRFGADFGRVRVHDNQAAATHSAALSANAFTMGQHIYFGRGKFQPHSAAGQELIAHELTHTIQQGAAVQRDVIRRSAMVNVDERVSPHVQRDFFGIPSPREYFANKAANIPGFTMLTVVIGFNPITNARVERNAGNILRGAIQLIPGGNFITDALNSHGIFDKISAWAASQFGALQDLGASIWQDIEQFLARFSITDLAHPGDLWDQARAIVQRPIDRIIAFATQLKDGIVTLIKDAILRPLATFAKTSNGYPLLCTVLGKDPITGEPVAQDAEALVGGFMKFIGEDELWATMQKANAIPRAFAWFNGALNAVRGFLSEIPRPVPTSLQVARGAGHHPDPARLPETRGRIRRLRRALRDLGRQRRLDPARDHLRRGEPWRARLHQEDRRRAERDPQESTAVRRQPGESGQARLLEFRRSFTRSLESRLDRLADRFPARHLHSESLLTGRNRKIRVLGAGAHLGQPAPKASQGHERDGGQRDGDRRRHRHHLGSRRPPLLPGTRSKTSSRT